MKKEFQYVRETKEPKAVLVAVSLKSQPEDRTEEYLDELAFLAETMGIRTVQRFVQRLDAVDTRTYVGKGKLEEIIAYVEHEEIDVIITDDDLTSTQVRNLDRYIQDVMVIDRSLLILQIFSRRAQTAQSRLQVELAQYQYMLPRLTNLWSHHSRQRGGVNMRGPGETELETDKRIVRDRIAFLKEKLEKVDRQSHVRRKSRDRMVRVALVGYTNVGKSTLMNLISRSEVFAENKLFATVDSTVRKVTMHNIPFLLSDTVGFIRKLPTTLIESFKSTLDEVVEADVLIHVVDISHDAFENQIEVVNQTLAEIKAKDKPTLMVFNKIDAFRDKEYPPFEENPPATVEEWKQWYVAKGTNAVFVSAVERENIEELRERLFKLVENRFYEIFPNYKDYDYNQLWRFDPEEEEEPQQTISEAQPVQQPSPEENWEVDSWDYEEEEE